MHIRSRTASVVLVWGAMGCGVDTPEDNDRNRTNLENAQNDQTNNATVDTCDDLEYCARWTGTAIVQGTQWDLDAIKPSAQSFHCSENSEHGVSVALSIPEDLGPSNAEMLLLRLGAQIQEIELGFAHPVATHRRSSESPAHAMAYLSPEGRISSAHRPDNGTIRFEAVEKGGPMDVFFQLNFGELGEIAGRVRSPATTPMTCLIPEAP